MKQNWKQISQNANYYIAWMVDLKVLAWYFSDFTLSSKYLKKIK